MDEILVVLTRRLQGVKLGPDRDKSRVARTILRIPGRIDGDSSKRQARRDKNRVIEADAEGYNYFVFTDDKDTQTKVKLPEGLKVKLSEKEGNAITQEDDGLYVSLTGVKISTKENNALENLSGDDEGLYVEGLKISEAEGNKLEKKNDGLYASGVNLSEEEGNQIEKKDDGIYVAAQKISEDENNIIESKDDGLYATVPISSKDKNKLSLENDGLYAEGVTVSEDAKNIIEELDDGIYVENITVSKTLLSDNTTKCDFKYKDTLLNSFILDNKSTLISGHVQQFGSAETVNVYKYVSGGVTVLSTSLIESTSDNAIVYDSNLRKFGVIKVDGDKFYIIGKESVKFDIDLSIVAEPKTLHNEGYNIVLVLSNEDFNTYIDINDVMSDITREEFDALAEKVAEIELFKFPNAIIKGEPTINNGHISNFSNTNYLILPSVFNLSGRGFEFKFAFTTSDDVSVAQNILGSKYCMALFIQGTKLYLRVSSNGTDWDLVNLEGNTTIEPNKTYYVKINFTRLNYVLSLSLDDEEYNEIGSVSTGDISPNPSELYLGIGNNFNNPFKGILNLNKCYLKVNQAIVWAGMDDAGLASRLATDLENIDEAGINRVKEIAETKEIKDKLDELQLYKYPNAIIHGNDLVINNGQISGFNANNYLAFPFLVDFGDRNFVIDMAFTTDSNVTAQQNIIDSKFGLALAIKNNHFVLAISTNGTGWDLGATEGSYNVLPNTNYYLKLSFNHSQYKLSYSLNKIDYIDDITVSSTTSPYPVQVLIGIGDLDTTPKPFKGIINMNYCYLTINDLIVWQGMDDVGISSRLSTDMANIDSAGIKRLNELVDKEIIHIKRVDYNKLPPEEKQRDDVIYNVYDDVASSLAIDDETVSKSTLWSSQKINDSLVDIEKNYGKKEIADCNTVEETISYIAPSTLHSPKAEGLTNNARGILISAIREAPDDYCVQTAILNGSAQHFTRYKLPNNDWSTWVELATMDKVGITVKRYTASNYSSSTSNYATLEATSKKRIILNAYYDYDANVAVSAYFVNNNQLRWKIVSGSVNEGHNVVIDYGEISN